MLRSEHLDLISLPSRIWDFAVIGGGATGASIALDAAARGCSVVLLEQSDFAKGTSSRSTKLVHGGVRYLQQGNIRLVREALRERSLLLKNANHLVHNLQFLLPCRNLWEEFFYGTGLKFYDLLALGSNFARTQMLTRHQIKTHFPALRSDYLRCGWLYHDGQFDDSRLVINLLQTAAKRGAAVLNYAPVTGLLKDSLGQIIGVVVQDLEAQREHTVHAKCVINAAGPFCDAIRKLDHADRAPIIATSQGVHVVLPKEFFPGKTAVIVPKTSDGRVAFMIPWHDHLVVGTTDTPIRTAAHEPSPLPEEIDFLLATAGDYLTRRPTRADVLSTFAGIRPLVLSKQGPVRTSALSRDFLIEIARSGLLTITGGKWTTVRKMAEACVDRALALAGIKGKKCVTHNLPIHGSYASRVPPTFSSVYGTDRPLIEQLASERPELAAPLHPKLPILGAEVVWAVRHEMARTVDDVLARRTRCLILNARAAIEVAPAVARIMATEMVKHATWEQEQVDSFRAIAQSYCPEGTGCSTSH